jgi:hypothetical protein
MNIRYEIDTEDRNAVYMWDLDNTTQTAPFMYQPHYPNGDAWASYEDAENWALLKIAELTDSSAPFAPAGYGLPSQPKPTEEEIRAMKLQATGLTVDDLKALLGL